MASSFSMVSKSHLSGAQKAALLLYLLKDTKYNEIVPSLTTKELNKLNNALFSLSSYINVKDDIAVLTELQDYALAKRLISPQEAVPVLDAQTLLDLQKQNAEMNPQDMAKVISMWLKGD